MEFGDILLQVGWGRYQIFHMILTSFLVSLLGLQFFGSIFVAYPVPHSCDVTMSSAVVTACNVSCNFSIGENLVPVDKQGKFEQCIQFDITTPTAENEICPYLANCSRPINFQTRPCNNYVYTSDGTVTSSVVTQFDLVCGRVWIRYLLQSIFMFGILLNGLVIGKATDRYGRRLVSLIMCVATAITGVGVSFTNSLPLYAVLHALVGFSCFFAANIYVIGSEMTIPSRRAMVLQISSFGLSSGTMIMVLFALLARHWRTFQLAISLAYIPVVVGIWIKDESPRWLISRGRYAEAARIIVKMAKFNKISEQSAEVVARFCATLDTLEDISDASTVVVREKQTDIGMTDTLRFSHLAKTTIIISYVWFATSCAFFGMTLNVANVGGNIYISTLIMGAMAIPMYPMAICACDKLGRQIVISSCLILVAVFSVPTFFVPTDMTEVHLALFMLARICSIIPLSTLFLYTMELYPTVIRSTATNFGNAMARVGAVIAPAIALLEIYHYALPYILFGIMSLVAGVLVLFLPETKHSQLCETMKDAEEFIAANPGPLKKLCCGKKDKQGEENENVGQQF